MEGNLHLDYRKLVVDDWDTNNDYQLATYLVEKSASEEILCLSGVSGQIILRKQRQNHDYTFLSQLCTLYHTYTQL